MFKVLLKLLQHHLQKIDVEGVNIKIIHTAVGAINESDISLLPLQMQLLLVLMFAQMLMRNGLQKQKMLIFVSTVLFIK